MNRLTEMVDNEAFVKELSGYTSVCFGCERIARCKTKCSIYNAIQKLATYEDTGLEPQDVETDKEIFEAYRHVCGGRPPEDITKALNLLNLEEQGLLIKLPCKVGDIIYVNASTIGTDDDIEYAEAEVVSVRITKKQVLVKLRVYALNFEQMPFGCKSYPVSSFGKTVFLTREEAEKALEASNGERT